MEVNNSGDRLVSSRELSTIAESDLPASANVWIKSMKGGLALRVMTEERLTRRTPLKSSLVQGGTIAICRRIAAYNSMKSLVEGRACRPRRKVEDDESFASICQRL